MATSSFPNVAADVPDLAAAVDWARAEGSGRGDRLCCGLRAHELCINVRNLVRDSLGAAPCAEAKEIVTAIGQSCANLLNKSAALDAAVGTPTLARFRNARPPFMCAIYDGNGPQLVTESYAQQVDMPADEMRKVFAEGGPEALNARLLTEKSARDAKLLIDQLAGLGFYRADFDYLAGVSLRSNTILLRRPETRKTWGSVRTLEDVTSYLKDRRDRRVTSEQDGTRYKFDQSLPGLRWRKDGQDGSILNFLEDVKNLPLLLEMVTQYRGAEGDGRQRDIAEALKNLSAFAVIMDHLWSSTAYLMRLTDQNGLKPNASMADVFGMPAAEIANLAKIDAKRLEAAKAGTLDADLEELAKNSGYGAHFYPHPSEQSFLDEMEKVYRERGYYFESFPALTDNVDAVGGRITEEISWDRYALHHPRLHADRRKFVESMTEFHLDQKTVDAIADADLRIGLPARNAS